MLEEGIEDERLAMVFAKVARHFGRQEEAVALLEKLLARGRMSETIVEPLHFNLGKLYDELKQYDKAFPHFEQANRLRPCYDPDAFLQQMNARANFVRQPFFTRAPRAENATERPIFIVGMPRSGQRSLSRFWLATLRCMAAES